VANILRRLDFASRAQVAVWASQHDRFDAAPPPGPDRAPSPGPR